MIRLTRKIFTDLTIWMIGLGLLMGIIFPFFMIILGVSTEQVLSVWFFAACMTAGFIVGGLNIWLARTIVGSRLHTLACHMKLVETALKEVSLTGNMEQCIPETCFMTIDSEDELGESASAFNYLIEALIESHRGYTAVRSFTEVLVSQLDLDIMTTHALQKLLEYMNANAGAILIATGGEIKIAASQGICSPDSLKSSDNVQRTLQTGRQLSVFLPDDITVDGVLTDFRPREVLLEPLLYLGAPFGVLILASAIGFKDELRSRLGLFCQGMTLALNNAITYDQLQRLAALDPLTGIYNRRFGMARLSEEFGRAIRTKTPLGVLMLDIDHFKRVNDTYGHLVGDRVLIQLAKTVRDAIRKGDIFMRYGGEEFMVILPGASKEDSRAIGEKIRRMVEDTSVTDGDQIIRITISIGATSYPELEVKGEEDLIKRADETLYQAKKTGRNKVVA